MIQKIKQKIKDKKGMSTFEFAICMIIFVIVIAFIIDLFVVSYKHYMVTANCTKSARVISIQGGISNECPENYPGGNPNYMTNREFRSYLNELADQVQKETGNFKVFLDYSYIDNYDNVIEKKDILVYKYTRNQNGSVSKTYYPQDFLLPYGSFITLRIEYTYEFFYTNIWNDAADRFKFHSSKSYVTEYVSYDFSYQINGQQILTVVEDLPPIVPNLGGGKSESDPEYFEYSGNTLTGLSEAGKAARDSHKLNTLVIPSNIDGTVITRIGDNAFAGCANIKAVTLSKNIKQVGKSAFEGCPDLERVDYYEGVKRIDESAFANCSNLKIFIPAYSYKDIDTDGVTYDVYRIVLPNSLEELHSKAFENCTYIYIVRGGESLIKMDEDVFNGSGVGKIFLATSPGSLLGNPWKQVEGIHGGLVPDTSVSVKWNTNRTN